MDLKFDFQGRARSRDSLVRLAQRIGRTRGYRVGAWPEGMRIMLCPMGYLDFSWIKEKGLFGGWRVAGSCVSTPVGPGFHRTAVELLREIGQKELKDLEVQDSTGDWEHRDLARLKQDYFYPWLRETMEQAAAELKADPGKEVRLFWEKDQYWSEPVPGTVATPMGRFSARWLEEKLEAGDIWGLAERIFLWNEQEADARFLRNCTLKRLWEDCYFAPSDRSAEDEQLNRFILDCLERAYQLEPTLPLPVTAYREVCILDDRPFRIPEDAPEMDEEFAPGYHKGEVIQSFDMLRVPLPGIYRYEWREDKAGSGCIWSDEEHDSPVWRFSGFQNKSGLAEWNADMSGFRDLETLERPNLKAHWGWKEIPNQADPDQSAYQILCEAAAGDQLFVITVAFARAEEREELYARLRRLEVEEKKN